jgi:hypothetical protein
MLAVFVLGPRGRPQDPVLGLRWLESSEQYG